MSWLGTDAWLVGFLEARGRWVDRGLPLYAYRTNDAEYGDLSSLIRTVSRMRVNPDRLSQVDCAVFCLYAAEWWRRNHVAGPWKWEGILEEIGWAGTPLPRLYPIVKSGLQFWKRSLLRTREERNLFLVTLACEGGLPLRLLSRESARLRTFFREALEEFQYFHRSGENPAAIVARLAERLPRSLRKEVVYQLAGNLVQRIWELQQKLGDSKNPVEALDLIEPNWRDELPLRVEDATARLLLNNLIEDASRVAAAVSGSPQIVTRIRQDGDGWLLEAEFKAPPRMSETEVSQLFDVRSQDVPPRLQLELVDSEGDRSFCGILTRFSTAPDSAFVVESIAGGTVWWSGVKARASRRLIGRMGARSVEAPELKGGSGLSDLPWVFVPTTAQEGTAKLVGQGSVSTRHEQVYVAVSPEIQPPSDRVPIGEIRGCNRVLYEVAGEERFAGVDGDCLVRTGQSAEANSEFYLHGDTLPFGRADNTVFVGPPRLRAVSETGVCTAVDELEWKGEASGDSWTRNFDHCVGEAWLRYRKAGELRYRSRAKIVPKDTTVMLIPAETASKGSALIRGTGAASIGAEVLDGTAEVRRHRSGDAFLIMVEAAADPPPIFRCEMRWDPGARISMELPFPARGGRFIGADGNALPNGSEVSMDHLPGVRAEAVYADQHGRFVVAGQMHATDIPSALFHEMRVGRELREEFTGHAALSLYDMGDSLRLMLALTEDLDATFRLRVEAITGRHVPPRVLNIKRFDGSLWWEKEQALVSIRASNLSATETGSLRLEARPLWDPEIDPEILNRTAPGAWTFDPGAHAAGPWLLLAWSGNHCGFRPLLCVVPDGADEQSAEQSGPITIASASRISDREARAAAFKGFFERLAAQASDPEWERFDRYLDSFRDVPAVALDLVRFLSGNVSAATMALIRCADAKFEYVWSLLESLPFFWQLVPVREWTRAAQKYVQTAGSEPPEIQALLIERVIGVFKNRLPARIRGAELIGAWITQKISTGIPSDSYSEAAQVLAWVTRPAARSHFMQSIAAAEEQLLQLHADQHWPPGPAIADFQRILSPQSELLPLWRPINEGTRFRETVLNAPIAAALACLCAVALDKTTVYQIRRLRDFDQDWFDTAYDNAMKIGMGILLEHGRELLE